MRLIITHKKKTTKNKVKTHQFNKRQGFAVNQATNIKGSWSKRNRVEHRLAGPNVGEILRFQLKQ